MVIDDVMVSLNDHETTQETVVRVLSENGRTVLSHVVDDITQAIEAKARAAAGVERDIL